MYLVPGAGMGLASSSTANLPLPSRREHPWGTHPAAPGCSCSESAGFQPPHLPPPAGCRHQEHLLTHSHMLRFGLQHLARSVFCKLSWGCQGLSASILLQSGAGG